MCHRVDAIIMKTSDFFVSFPKRKLPFVSKRISSTRLASGGDLSLKGMGREPSGLSPHAEPCSEALLGVFHLAFKELLSFSSKGFKLSYTELKRIKCRSDSSSRCRSSVSLRFVSISPRFWIFNHSWCRSSSSSSSLVCASSVSSEYVLFPAAIVSADSRGNVAGWSYWTARLF